MTITKTRPNTQTLTPSILALWLALGSTSTSNAQDAPQLQPDRERLITHVATLASPEFEGRRGAGGRKAEAYVTDHLRALGLQPLFPDGSFAQDIPGREPGTVLGRNVGAKIVGSDPNLRDEIILLSAHYDHLGTRNGLIYPGADDNASGVAMLLETARCLADSETPQARTIWLVSFDLEEDGLFGSRHFAAHPPAPLDRVRLFLTADLIGGALADVCRDEVFVLGWEHAPGLLERVKTSAQGQPIRVAPLGSDVLVIDRSDYGPFRLRKIPYLFFSTGEHPRYHSPRDTADHIDAPKLEAISRTIARVVRSAAADPNPLPAWSNDTLHPVDEAAALAGVLRILLAHAPELKLEGTKKALVESALKQAESVEKHGAYRPGERTKLVRLAQIVLFTVL
jgi:hypothetical protein